MVPCRIRRTTENAWDRKKFAIRSFFCQFERYFLIENTPETET